MSVKDHSMWTGSTAIAKGLSRRERGLRVRTKKAPWVRKMKVHRTTGTGSLTSHNTRSPLITTRSFERIMAAGALFAAQKADMPYTGGMRRLVRASGPKIDAFCTSLLQNWGSQRGAATRLSDFLPYGSYHRARWSRVDFQHFLGAT